MKKLSITGILMLSSAAAFAGVSVPKNLPLPVDTVELTGSKLAEQVYFVNHFYAFSQMPIEYQPRGLNIIVKKAGDSVHVDVMERYIDTRDSGGVIANKEVIVVRNGRDRSTGMLNYDYLDDSRSKHYRAWLPSLRKIRRFGPPHHSAPWGGTAMSYGDATLRRVSHEDHVILGTQTFNETLGMLDLTGNQNPWLQQVPPASADHVGKEVYVMRSTPKTSGWWYDYRVSYVDVQNYADYRTEYFKDGELVKVLDRDWMVMGMPDPRGQAWKYWYVKDYRTGQESLMLMNPQGLTREDAFLRPNFFTETTLRRLHR